MPVREASTQWQGDLKTGSGVVTLESSKAAQFPVTFPARTGEPEGHTSPEELLAAAHSACFAMSLSNALAQARCLASQPKRSPRPRSRQRPAAL